MRNCISCKSACTFTPRGLSVEFPGIPAWRCSKCGSSQLSKVAFNALDFHMGVLYNTLHEIKSSSELDSVLPYPQGRIVKNVIGYE
jgi:hypothetical protein